MGGWQLALKHFVANCTLKTANCSLHIAYCLLPIVLCSSSSSFLFPFHQRYPIKPTMAKGDIIKYRMAVFIPCAGFSPSWEDVLVQTAHCASTAVDRNNTKNKTSNMFKIYFILLYKVTAACGYENICLTEIN